MHCAWSTFPAPASGRPGAGTCHLRGRDSAGPHCPGRLAPARSGASACPATRARGVVIEDPSGRFCTGERVLFFAGPGGVTQDGTFAEMASVPSGNLASLPAEIPDEIVGGLPVAYLSAFLALRQAGFRGGQSVLAPSSRGGVGRTNPPGAPARRASKAA